jgi:hypothetical protein
MVAKGLVTISAQLGDPPSLATAAVISCASRIVEQWRFILNHGGSHSRSLLRRELLQTSSRPSFPNASIGGSTELTTGETGIGPPIKTFGGDAFGINARRYDLILAR